MLAAIKEIENRVMVSDQRVDRAALLEQSLIRGWGFQRFQPQYFPIQLRLEATVAES